MATDGPVFVLSLVDEQGNVIGSSETDAELAQMAKELREALEAVQIEDEPDDPPLMGLMS